MLFDTWKPINFSTTSLRKVELAATDGDRSALFAGSLALECGFDFIPQIDRKAALEWTEIGTRPLAESEKNDAEVVGVRYLCEIRFGIMRCFGYGLMANREEGLAHIENSKAWVLDAASKGHAYAQTFLGLLYSHGYSVPKKDSESVKWFELAAAQKEICGAYNLAVCLLFGNGIKRDIDRAESIMNEGEQRGMIYDRKLLAKRFQEKRRWNDAARLWEKGAQRGDWESIVAMGDLHMKKEAGQLYNPGKAFPFYLNAENKGDIDGMERVAKCYEMGLPGVVEQNLAEAFARYTKLMQREGDTEETASLSSAKYNLVRTRWEFLNRAAKAEICDGVTSLQFKDGSILHLSREDAEKRLRCMQERRRMNPLRGPRGR